MTIIYEKQGRIATFIINRPEVLNALNSQALQELQEAMLDFRDDPNLWVGIITGAGEKAFSVGIDIKEKTDMQKEEVEIVRADTIWKPFIAAINGYCLGGGLELALTCDIRIAATHAHLGQPEVLRGFFGGGGNTQRLPRFISPAKAAEIIFTGKQIDAQEAYRIGLINQVVPLSKLMPTVKEWAESICQAAPLGVRAAKESIIRGYSLPLEEGLQLEKSLRNLMPLTEDFAEGTRAFVEKRKPIWKAR